MLRDYFPTIALANDYNNDLTLEEMKEMYQLRIKQIDEINSSNISNTNSLEQLL